MEAPESTRNPTSHLISPGMERVGRLREISAGLPEEPPAKFSLAAKPGVSRWF
jgi:hypothetical protein